MGWALVAISHCMSLQTAGQESNRTTVFWWWVHSMLGNDFDIFWWVIYSAKFNFDLMPVLWRCVFLFIDWFGCHSRVSLQALLVSFPNKPMRVPAASTAMGEAFWPSPCQARLKRKSDVKRWIWRFWMLIISYIYIIITYKKYNCLLLVFAIWWYLLHDLHVVYLRMSQDPVNFPRPICQRSLWHHQDPARHPTAAAACCMSKDVLLSVAVLLGVEWVPPELAQNTQALQQRRATWLHYAEDANQMCDTTWYDMIWHDMSQI